MAQFMFQDCAQAERMSTRLCIINDDQISAGDRIGNHKPVASELFESSPIISEHYRWF